MKVSLPPNWISLLVDSSKDDWDDIIAEDEDMGLNLWDFAITRYPVPYPPRALPIELKGIAV